jgi:hypothetical protein
VVEGGGEGAGAAGGGGEDEERPDAIDLEEERAQEGLEGRGRQVLLVRRGVVLRPVGVGHFGEAELVDVPREGGLRDVEAGLGEEFLEPRLAGDAVLADDAQEGGVALGLHSRSDLALGEKAGTAGSRGTSQAAAAARARDAARSRARRSASASTSGHAPSR